MNDKEEKVVEKRATSPGADTEKPVKMETETEEPSAPKPVSPKSPEEKKPPQSPAKVAVSPGRRKSASRSASRSPSRRQARHRSPTPPPKPSKVHIGGLTRNVNKDHVIEIFSLHGKIRTVDLPLDRVTQLNRGFSYIQFESAADAEAAIKYMDGAQVDGKEITVQMVLIPDPPKPRRRSPPRRSPGRSVRKSPPRGSPGRYRSSYRTGRRSRSPRRVRSPRRPPRRSRSPRRSPRKERSPYRRPRSKSPPKRKRYSHSSSSDSKSSD